MPQVVIGSFNAHAGVDGWGRPYDLASIVEELSADAIVLQESWSPEMGTALSDRVADHTGGAVVEMTLAQGALASPHPADPAGWGPPLFSGHPWRALRLDYPGTSSKRVSARPTPGRVAFEGREPLSSVFPGPTPGGPVASNPSKSLGPRRGENPSRERRRGKWKIAIISTLPITATASIDLGQLRRDPARRGALSVEISVAGETLCLIGTHLSHLTHGSPFQLRRLYSQLPKSEIPAVLCGDMNLWGPVVSSLLPHWRRAVKGRTWPSWAPHSQLDHIFVTPPVEVVQSQVLKAVASDHRAVRAILQF